MKPVKKDPPRKPIYVSNPNDPRLKDYKDSLSLYNKTKEIENPKNYVNDRLSGYTFNGNDEQFEMFARKNNVDYEEEYPKTGRFPGKIQPESVGYIEFPRQKLKMAYPKYKKPVQPVEYKKLERVEIAPKERSMPTSSIKVNRSVNFPKAVTNIKYDTQKGDVIVGISGKDVTMPRKEFDSWVNKPENRKMFDDYRKAKSKK
jgi:hypothetical protein